MAPKPVYEIDGNRFSTLEGFYDEISRVQKQLETCHPSNRGSVAQELDEARQGRGMTIFDELIGIISIHSRGGREGNDGVELVLK